MSTSKLKINNNTKKTTTANKSSHIICGIFRRMWSNLNIGRSLLHCQLSRFVFNHPSLGTKVGTTPLMKNDMKMMTAILYCVFSRPQTWGGDSYINLYQNYVSVISLWAIWETCLAKGNNRGYLDKDISIKTPHDEKWLFEVLLARRGLWNSH